MSLFSLLSVSASGMSAQRTRAELLVENLANSETTRTPDGGPYRRKDAVFATDAAESPFSSVFESQLGRPDGVRVAVFKQQTAPKGGSWVDAQVDPRTNIDIENAILTRAR